MGKRGRLIRTSVWILVPLTVGVAAGLGASKSLWDYWWVPPAVYIDPAAHPRAIAFFSRWPSLEVKPIADRNEVLGSQLTRCSGGQTEECTYGRVLLQTRNVEWIALPVIADSSVHTAFNAAQRLSPAAFVREGQNGTGVVAIYDLHGETLTLVAFNTAELHDDTHGYAEMLLRGSGGDITLSDSISYYYDVAGIEFATPRVLVLLGIILAFAVAALVAAVGFLARRGMPSRFVVPGIILLLSGLVGLLYVNSAFLEFCERHDISVATATKCRNMQYWVTGSRWSLLLGAAFIIVAIAPLLLGRRRPRGGAGSLSPAVRKR